jgi:hypothetical protein
MSAHAVQQLTDRVETLERIIADRHPEANAALAALRLQYGTKEEQRAQKVKARKEMEANGGRVYTGKGNMSTSAIIAAKPIATDFETRAEYLAALDDWANGVTADMGKPPAPTAGDPGAPLGDDAPIVPPAGDEATI